MGRRMRITPLTVPPRWHLIRYASMLEVTMDPHKPHVCDIPAEDLVSFCHDRCDRCDPCEYSVVRRKKGRWPQGHIVSYIYTIFSM